jgi:hypothetical protein
MSLLLNNFAEAIENGNSKTVHSLISSGSVDANVRLTWRNGRQCAALSMGSSGVLATAVGAGVGAGVGGVGVGSGVGAGEGLGVGSDVGIGVGSGLGAGVGSGVG